MSVKVIVKCWLEARAGYYAYFQRRHSCALHAVTGGAPLSTTTAETRVTREKAQTDRLYCTVKPFNDSILQQRPVR